LRVSSQTLLYNSYNPVVASLCISFFVNFLVSWLNLNFTTFLFSVICGVFCFFGWMFCLNSESFTHFSKTNDNLQTGMKLFLVSEAFLFFSFFWRYFNFCWSYELKTAGFPFMFSFVIDRFGVPILNTTLLLTSRFYCTYRMHSLLIGNFLGYFLGFFFLFYLGCFLHYFKP
jgi:heme/copper-type cytochrome/quinol oxidase subunit 3